jgi:hypothetical protein
MLKPVLFPSEKTAPKRSLIGVVWLFLGIVARIGFVLAKEPVTSIVQKNCQQRRLSNRSISTFFIDSTDFMKLLRSNK